MNRNPGLLEAIARILISSIYIFYSGNILVYPAQAMERMMQAGIPAVPVLFVIALTFLILGSLGLALGYRTRSAALALLVLTLLEYLFVRSPWKTGDPHLAFMFLSLMGGLLLVIVYGAGSWSFDARSMVPVRRKKS